LRDDIFLVPSPTVSNAISIRLTAPVAASKTAAWDTYSDTRAATDGLGRVLPMFEEVGGPRPNKTVGVFYYLWHSYHSREALANNQPVFGYYNASDRWVLRKQAQMLSDAGTDVLLHDSTNELYYWPEWLEHADFMKTLRQSGQKTPDIAFIFGLQHRSVSTMSRSDFMMRACIAICGSTGKASRWH
jgi:hypothetical protein